MNTYRHTTGFSLVEVMVALLILSGGVIGVVALQSNLLKSEQGLEYRELALQVATAKFDDLRTFIDIEDKPSQFDYNEIINNAGGALAAGDVLVKVSADSGEEHTFNRQWQVTDQYYVDTDADGTLDTWVTASSPNAPSPLPTTPTQKLVSVSVSWTDINGATKQINVDGSLAPVPVSRSFQAANEGDDAKQKPIVSYTPGQAPDVISYELGNGEKVETSKPVPDIKNNGSNIVVNFETVRYIQVDNDTDKLEQEDFVTLNCSCTLAGEGQGKTPAMTVLNEGELITELGSFVQKMTGIPANSQQAPLCNSCCRDHHDTSDMVNKEIQYRAEGGVPHSHYKRASNGTYALASNAGDDYDEICRFKRVNGLFEIYPDWELVDIIDFSDQYLFNTTALNNYTNYSEGLITAKIKGTAAPARPVDRDRTVLPGGYQYVARGIYVDRLKAEHKAAVIQKINDGDESWKAITPFYDINLTLLANWSSSNTLVADVTQEPIESIVDPANDYYGTYSRGRLEALDDGTASLRVMAYAGNAGIIGGEAISTVTKSDIRKDEEIEIVVDAKSSSEKFFGLIGNVSCLITINNVTDACETNNVRKNTYVDLSVLNIIEFPSNFSCSITIPKGKATPFYSCQNVPEGWNGLIQFSLSVPQASTTVTVQYPNSATNDDGTLFLPSGLSASSTNEYNVIINVVK